VDEAKDSLQNLRAIVRGLGPLAVAYSGGVDSTLLLKVAHDELGDSVVAIIASSMLMPSEEVVAATSLARRMGVESVVVEVDLTGSPEVMGNHIDRCYHCKRIILGIIIERAQALGINSVVDGSHVGDRPDDRPGMQALRELGVRSPLAEAGLTKEQIRDTARALDLSVALQPPSPCLATRVPFFEPLTVQHLGQIDRAERFLRDRGYHHVRVRHHGTIARIEVDSDDLGKVIIEREAILAALCEIGFVYVTLDLRGFRSGSMSEVPVTRTAEQ
jgi:uncharacterized protein